MAVLLLVVGQLTYRQCQFFCIAKRVLCVKSSTRKGQVPHIWHIGFLTLFYLQMAPWSVKWSCLSGQLDRYRIRERRAHKKQNNTPQWIVGSRTTRWLNTLTRLRCWWCRPLWLLPRCRGLMVQPQFNENGVVSDTIVKTRLLCCVFALICRVIFVYTLWFWGFHGSDVLDLRFLCRAAMVDLLF